MTDRKRLLLVLACALFAATCAGGQKISTESDGSFDFSQHQKYMWKGNRLMTRQNPDTNEVLDRKIVKAVNKQLAAKGFIVVKENPDFYVFYDGGGSSQIGRASCRERVFRTV